MNTTATRHPSILLSKKLAPITSPETYELAFGIIQLCLAYLHTTEPFTDHQLDFVMPMRVETRRLILPSVLPELVKDQCYQNFHGEQ